jgi:hypothetical protein
MSGQVSPIREIKLPLQIFVFIIFAGAAAMKKLHKKNGTFF